MTYFNNPLVITTLAHVLLVFAVGVRVVMKRSAPGVAFAWLFLVVMLPIAGALIYLLVGERRIGRQRTHRIDSLLAAVRKSDDSGQWSDLTAVDWSRHPPAAAGLHRRVGGGTRASRTDTGNEVDESARIVLMACMLDTDTVSFILRGQGRTPDRFRAKARSDVCVSL